MAGNIRVVLIDDNLSVRTGLKVVLEIFDGVDFVGEAENAEQAIALCQQLQPDIALIDILMPDIDGLEIARRVRQDSPKTRCIMLSAVVSEPLLRRALEAGVRGYLLKTNPITTIERAIHDVYGGQRAFCEEVRQVYLRLSPDEMTGSHSESNF